MGCGINTLGLILNYIIGYLFEKKMVVSVLTIWLGMAVISTVLSIWWNCLDRSLGGDAQRPSHELEMDEEEQN